MPSDRASFPGCAGPDRDGSDRADPERPGLGSGWRPGPDRDLVDCCLDHESGAWEEFLRRYGRLIYSTIHKVGLCPEDQEDAFQSSVMAIYRQLPKLRDREKIASWIVGITWRQSVNRIRLRSREIRMEEVEDPALSGRLDPPADAILPDEHRVALEQAQHAMEALDSLPVRCRRLLILMFYEHPPLDYVEISRREGVPIGSLGPTRARCLLKMRRFFRERGWTA
jgi:RNA polymerase sigma factor (sigma-70 family)